MAGDGPVMSFLTRTWRLGLEPPLVIDLVVVKFTLGLGVDVGLLTVVAAAVSLFLYVRMR